jgi:hypothetical protein
MTRNLAYATACFLAALAYFLAGFVTQGLMDKSQWDLAGFALTMSLVISALIGLVVFGGLTFFQRRFGQGEKATPYRPARGLMATTAAAVCVTAVLGIWVSRAKVMETQALAAAARSAAAAERARIAALTPEQLAAMAKQREEQAAAAAKAAAEKELAAANEKERKAKRDAQLQLAASGALTLKRAMKDPESFNLTSLVVKDSGAACYEYRAKNSFGAILPSSAVLTSRGKLLTQTQDGNTFVGAWNKECTPAGGDEIAETIRRLGVI